MPRTVDANWVAKSPPTAAARWTTASARPSASTQAGAARRTSPATTVTRSSSRHGAAATERGLRTMAITSWPWAIASATT